MVIEYSNLKSLDGEEKVILKSIIESGFKKISHLVSDPKLHVSIKIANKGKAKRYTISLVLNCKEGIFKTRNKDTEYADYEITKATHKVIDHLSNEVKLRARTEVPSWQKRNIKGIVSRFFR